MNGSKTAGSVVNGWQRRADIILMVLIALGVLARFYTIQDPLFRARLWRQYDTAAIARNFYEQSSNILYPSIDWRGNSAGYVEAEFQIYTFAVSLLYRIFGVHEWLGLAFNIVVYALGALLLFRFAKRLLDTNAALAAVFFYSVVPLSFFSTRSFQPDALMSLCCLASVYYFWIWTEEGELRSLAVSAIAMSLAVSIKPLCLYLGLPLFYLAHRRLGWKLLRKPALLLFGMTVVLPSVLWYSHAYQLWKMSGNTVGVFAGEVKAGPWKLLDSNWLTLAKRLLLRTAPEVVPLPAVVFLILGLFRTPARGNYLLLWWLAGFIVSIVLAPAGYLGHDYYALPIVFVTSILMGSSAAFLWRRSPMWRGLVAVGCVLVVGMSAWQLREIMRPDGFYLNRVVFDKHLNRLTEPGALVVFASPRFYPFHREYYQHRTAQGEYLFCDPVDFYLSHRKGWSIDDVQASSGLLELLRQRGAKYFATIYPEVITAHPELKTRLEHAYTAIEVTRDWAIYALREPTSPSTLDARSGVRSLTPKNLHTHGTF